MRVEQVDGAGAVCFDASGRVSMVVQDDLAELFDEAERRGMSADDVLNRMLDSAERPAAELEKRCTCRRDATACHRVGRRPVRQVERLSS